MGKGQQKVNLLAIEHKEINQNVSNNFFPTGN